MDFTTGIFFRKVKLNKLSAYEMETFVKAIHSGIANMMDDPFSVTRHDVLTVGYAGKLLKKLNSREMKKENKLSLSFFEAIALYEIFMKGYFEDNAMYEAIIVRDIISQLDKEVGKGSLLFEQDHINQKQIPEANDKE